MIATLVVTVVVGAAVAVAMQPTHADSWTFWAALCLPYLALSAWAVVTLKQAGVLGQRLRLRGGDLAIGILLGLVMATIGFVATRWMAPLGSPRAEWLARVYLQVGNLHARTPLILLLASLALMEELVWRGLVIEALRARVGAGAAVTISALAYALAHIVSVFSLVSERAGLNPLLPLAALGCGLCWGMAAVFLQRLWPVIISHAVFTYFMAGPVPALL